MVRQPKRLYFDFLLALILASTLPLVYIRVVEYGARFQYRVQILNKGQHQRLRFLQFTTPSSTFGVFTQDHLRIPMCPFTCTWVTYGPTVMAMPPHLRGEWDFLILLHLMTRKLLLWCEKVMFRWCGHTDIIPVLSIKEGVGGLNWLAFLFEIWDLASGPLKWCIQTCE